MERLMTSMSWPMRRPLLHSVRRGTSSAWPLELLLLRTVGLLANLVASQSMPCRISFERGIVYSIRAYQIPECSRTSAGNLLIQIVPVPPCERITPVQPVSDFADDQYLVMLATGGFVKRTALSSFAAIRSTGIVAIQLTPGDELNWVPNAAEEDTVALASQRGMAVCVGCNDDKLRARGRATRGVRAMRLRGDDKLAAMDIVPASLMHTKEKKSNAPWLLMVTEDGFGKRVPIKAFPKGVAGRVGVIGCKFHEVTHLYFQENSSNPHSF